MPRASELIPGRLRHGLPYWITVIPLSLVLAGLTAVAQTPAKPVFRVVSPSGINMKLENSPTPRKHLIETMAGGVGLLDYNSDGLLDIFFVNGGDTSGRLGVGNFDRQNPRYWNRLYRQNPDGSFTDVTEKTALSHAGDGNYGQGVAIADYDNDGYPEIYITNYGKNQLFHNNGDGTFTDVTEKAGVAAGGWSVSAGFFDYDNDGKLDLFVVRYLDWDPKRSKVCGGGLPSYCPPTEFGAVSNILYHNEGNGAFKEVSAQSGIAAYKGHGLGVAFADYDGDGLTDIFVSNDVVEQFLFHNNGDGTFAERGLDAGVALTQDGKMLSGMGIVFQDYDNDGRPDIIVDQLPPGHYNVFHNDGDGIFSDRTLESGFGTLSGSVSGWSMGLEDFDDDGWKDLFIIQGHVIDTVEHYTSFIRYREPPLLALNHNGRFERADCGTDAAMAGRGAAFGDLKNDGKIDVITTELGSRPLLFLNNGGNNNWLGIVLRGTRSNRDGFGARVVVNHQTRFATATSGYLSSNDKRLHFGLGTATSANVEIFWPSGIHQVLNGVKANKYVEVQEPAK